jgi:hypothetical protein
MRTLRRAAGTPLDASSACDQAFEAEPTPLAPVQLQPDKAADRNLEGTAAVAPSAKTESMANEFSPIDASGTALNVAVRGQHVLVLLPSGQEISLSIPDAKRSLLRLADAIAVAEGRPPVVSQT